MVGHSRGMAFGSWSWVFFSRNRLRLCLWEAGSAVAAAGRWSSHSYYFLALSHHISALRLCLQNC